jgi:hypothetical protein
VIELCTPGSLHLAKAALAVAPETSMEDPLCNRTSTSALSLFESALAFYAAVLPDPGWALKLRKPSAHARDGSRSISIGRACWSAARILASKGRRFYSRVLAPGGICGGALWASPEYHANFSGARIVAGEESAEA